MTVRCLRPILRDAALEARLLRMTVGCFEK
jgi:hypothetical protein